jgi:hypothetical protein
MAFLPVFANEKPFSQEEDFSPPSLTLTLAAHKLMDGWPDGKLHGWIKTALSAGRLSSSSSVGSRWKAFNLWENFRLRFFSFVVVVCDALLSHQLRPYSYSLARCYTGYLTRRHPATSLQL